MAAALAAGVAMFAVMALAWVAQLGTGRSGWIDAIWSLGTGLCGAGGALAVGQGGRGRLVAACALLWALRLAVHIAGRTLHGPDDARYAAFRAEHGARYQAWLFRFLMIQAAAALPLIGAVMLAAAAPAPALRLTDAAAVALLLLAVLGAGLADRQKERFRRDPAHRGQVCDRGLWAWSRHPNYFFEWLGWFAWPLFALGGGSAWGVLALLAPAEMYWLLVHVSGIPPLEAAMERSRGAAWRAYRARTSAFFPWFPTVREE
jgi:steroid 5-alpha reductase family enzyme